VLGLSAQSGDGIERLVSAMAEHWTWLAAANRLAVARRLQSEAWLVDAIRERFGREGLRRAAIEAGEGAPFRRLAALTARLS
jgi:LAO/AO transport system kinase